MALATFTITNDGQFLLVTSTETGSIESLSLTEIKDVTCTRVAPMVGTYPYVDMNILTVEINGRSADLTFDLAAVTNQAGWTLDLAGCNQAQADIRGWAASGATGGGATEATQLLIKANTESDPTVLISVKTTAAGTIPIGSKAASIFIDGVGGKVNNVERPDGWSQSFEFNNNTLPAISYDGMGTATVYVDILT